MFAASKTDSASTGGYQISRSLRFNSADSAYLNRTPATATNRRTYTFSTWVKRSKSGDFRTIFSAATDTSNLTIIRFKDDDKIEVRSATGGSTVFQLATTQVFRDYSAWYHFVLAVDTTNATGGDRVRLYVNGSEVTTFDTDTIPTQNADSWINNNILHEIGRQANNASNYYQDGYMTEMYLIDGTQLTPSSFGETNAQTGVWQPKAYSGSYGTNGFYLNFSDNSNTTAATLGKDYSGNGNNWTPNNFSVTAGTGNDSMVDVPTPYGVDTGVGGTVRGNYCTLNPLAVKIASAVTLSNGNLDAATVTSGDICYATMGMSSGKWYWEVTCISGVHMIGISKDVFPITDWQTANGLAYYSANGNKYTNGAGSAYGATFTTNDVIGLALDMDAGTLVFYKNGTTQGTAFTGITGTYFASVQNAGANGTMSFNFGQRAFANTAPSGFKALCTQNLPTPTIGATSTTQAEDYFGVSLWTGNSSTQAITNSGSFQPDMVWIKARSTGTYNHQLFDAVRGTNKVIYSNLTNAEFTDTDGLTAFNSNGFTMGAEAGINNSGDTYVGWQWKANGSGSTNTAGSITSTVSANTTSGFSIVTWTGTGVAATVGHGLGVAPSIIFVKQRTNQAGYNWFVYNQTIGNTQWLILNDQRAASSATNAWNNTSPTSTVFSVSGYDEVNRSTSTFVAYCFADVAGYSKAFSYTANGSTDGPFVYLGFRPAYLLIKGATTTGAWWLIDCKRSTYNLVDKLLFANLSNAEDTYGSVDLLSNGFKIRNNNSDDNTGTYTYIGMAFAEFPFKYSLAR